MHTHTHTHTHKGHSKNSKLQSGRRAKTEHFCSGVTLTLLKKQKKTI